MKKNLLSLMAFSAILMGSLSSCVYDKDGTDMTETTPNKGGFTINVTTGEYVTRATTITSDPGTVENTVKDIVIAIFNSGDTQMKYLGIANNVSNRRGEYTINSSDAGVQLPTADPADKVMIAVNVDKERFAACTNTTEFRAVVLNATDIVSDADAITQNHLPMVGEGIVEEDGEGFVANVNVTHLTSKIVLRSIQVDFCKANDSETAQFTPKRIFLVNVPDHSDFNMAKTGAVNTPGAYNFANINAAPVTKFYQGASATAVDYATTSELADEKQYMAALSTTTPVSSDKLYGTQKWSHPYYFYTLPNNSATRKTRLVIEGTYFNNAADNTGETVYYPIEIASLKDSEGNDLGKVDANYVYNLDVIIGRKGLKADEGGEASEVGPYGSVGAFTVAYMTANLTVSNRQTTIDGNVNFSHNGAEYTQTAQSAHSPIIGEYLYSDGTWGKYPDTDKIVGVIFSNTPYNTTNNGSYSHGLAIALKDASSNSSWATVNDALSEKITPLAWTGIHTSDAYPIITDLTLAGNIGLDNYKAMIGVNGDEETEGAFYLVSQYTAADISGFENSGWFLPSIGELITMAVNITGRPIDDYAKVDTWVEGNASTAIGIYYNQLTPILREKMNDILDGTGGTDGVDFNYFAGGKAFGTGVRGNESATGQTNIRFVSSTEWNATKAIHMTFAGNDNLHFTFRSPNKALVDGINMRVRPIIAF